MAGDREGRRDDQGLSLTSKLRWNPGPVRRPSHWQGQLEEQVKQDAKGPIHTSKAEKMEEETKAWRNRS